MQGFLSDIFYSYFYSLPAKIPRSFRIHKDVFYFSKPDYWPKSKGELKLHGGSAQPTDPTDVSLTPFLFSHLSVSPY